MALEKIHSEKSGYYPLVGYGELEHRFSNAKNYFLGYSTNEISAFENSRNPRSGLDFEYWIGVLVERDFLTTAPQLEQIWLVWWESLPGHLHCSSIPCPDWVRSMPLWGVAPVIFSNWWRACCNWRFFSCSWICRRRTFNWFYTLANTSTVLKGLVM